MDTDLILLKRFIEQHPMQAAQAIEGLEDEAVAAFIEEIPAVLAVRLISLMNIYKVAKCFKLIKIDLAVKLLEKSGIEKAESLVRQVNVDFRNELLDRLSPKLSAILLQKLDYPASSVGALMTPLTFLLREGVTVKDAIKALKKEKGPIPSSVCVVKEDGTLAGIARVQDFLLADEADPISAVMKTEITTFFAELPVESIKNHPGWYENRSIPVVDGSDKLIGTLHFETALKNNLQTGEERAKHVMETSSALGELYLIGLTAFLQSVSKED